MTPDADCRSVVYAVRNTTQQRDFQSFRDIFDRYLQEQASAADLLTVASAPLMTGFSALDELLGGIQRSDLIILAARPSVGKSTLALNIAMHNAKADQTCAIFSLEMTADQLAMRALASETGIDSHRIRIAAASKIAELGYSDNDDLEITLRQAEDTNLEKMVGAMVRTGNSTVRFTSFSPARRPGAVTQAVYFANMALLDLVVEGDTLVVTHIDRLSRGLTHGLQVIEGLHRAGVEFRSLSEDFNTATATGKLQLTMVLAFSEWWRNSIRERSVAGQAKARAEGRFPGRRPSLNER